MIVTTFFKQKSGYCGFHSQGHAGYAVHGRDIVCAGVSVLAFSIVNALERFVGNNRLQVVCKDEGDLKLTLTKDLSPAAMHDAQVLLETLYLSLSNLQDTYPKYLKVVIEEVL